MRPMIVLGHSPDGKGSKPLRSQGDRVSREIDGSPHPPPTRGRSRCVVLSQLVVPDATSRPR